MEAKLFRLTIALSLLALIGFGIPGISASRSSSSWHELIVRLNQDLLTFKNKCAASVDSNFRYTDPKCTQQEFDAGESLLNQYWQYRREADDQEDLFLTLALGTPAGLFLLFFGGRWILTGRMRKEKKRLRCLAPFSARNRLWSWRPISPRCGAIQSIL